MIWRYKKQITLINLIQGWFLTFVCFRPVFEADKMNLAKYPLVGKMNREKVREFSLSIIMMITPTDRSESVGVSFMKKKII